MCNLGNGRRGVRNPPTPNPTPQTSHPTPKPHTARQVMDGFASEIQRRVEEGVMKTTMSGPDSGPALSHFLERLAIKLNLFPLCRLLTMYDVGAISNTVGEISNRGGGISNWFVNR